MLKLVAAAVIGVTLLSGAGSVSGHGKVDQKATGPEFGSFTIEGFGLAQTFIPQDPVLSGVSLGLQATRAGETNVTVNIHHGTVISPIIASSTLFIPDQAAGEPFDYIGPTLLVHFDFSPSVAVTPGDTYVIEVAADSFGQEWAFIGLDAYRDGSAFLSSRQTDWDFVFQTCGSRGGSGQPCKSKTVVLDKFKKSHGPGCIDFDNDIVCEPF